MNHPFALELSDLEAVDLDFEENLTDEAAAEVGGGYRWSPIIKDPRYLGLPIKYPPTQVTTLALGEEGGSPPPYTTLALGEEGGSLDLAL